MSNHEQHAPLGFWRKYVFSLDHKVIGLQYIGMAVVMALLGSGLAMIMRIQLAWPGAKLSWLGKLFPNAFPEGLLAPEHYLSIITMHGTVMVFFVISLALVSGFGNYLIPIQIGARDMAYPFLNALSFWVMVPACLVMIASFFVEGGAAASGWTAYPPLSALKNAVPGSQWGQTLWLLAMALFIVSFTMGGLNYVTTVLNLRAKGMSLMRMPLTIWTMFIAAIIGLVSFPPLTAAAIMLLFDRHGGTSFFVPAGLSIAGKPVMHDGGTPLLWQHLFWFLGHPEVYVLILPGLGITFEILATHARKTVFGYKMIVWCLIVIAVLGCVVWGHHMFVSGMNPWLGEFFTIGTLIITIPSAIIGLCMLATLYGGSLRLNAALLFALGTLALFGTGGFGGVFLGNATSDIFLHDSYFVVGHFHFMIGGVTLFATLAGLYHWFPKMFGRHLNEGLGKIHFWLSILGFYGMFLTMHFVGINGAPRRYYDFKAYKMLEGLQTYHLCITISAFTFAVASIIFLLNVTWSLWRGKKAERNPWDATTLEWVAPSPPPHGNWDGPDPVVHRWPYDLSTHAGAKDFAMQTEGPDKAPVTS
ncbi:MAG: Alternative cytochrome c oxidase subunit 1 [Verrucomicrobiae bacterium]|nr:Alternative cytochrome c oxidase subunit 1 [Verrucomicrobiae bacterium]